MTARRDGTLDCDRYKLALLTVRVLLGNHSVTPADVRARPTLPREVGDLAALATEPGSRPTAERRVAALTGDAAAGGGRIALSCFPVPGGCGNRKAVFMPVSRAQDGNRR